MSDRDMRRHDSRMEQQEHTSHDWVRTLRSIRRWVIWLAILGTVQAVGGFIACTDGLLGGV